MTGRFFRIAIGWLAMLTALPAAAQAPDRAADPAADRAASVRAAYLFAFPVYEMMRVRANMVAAGGGAANRFSHRTRLSTAADRGVTAPNNDTLYSSAWIDLAAGPVTLTLPALPRRYHSVELMDLFTDAFAVLGTRESGGRGGRIMLVGPGWRGRKPAGARVVRAPTNDVWAVNRILVDGPADREAALGAQAAFTIAANGASFRGLAEPTPALPDPEQFLAVVNAALARGPLPPIHRARLGRFAAAGIRPGAAAAWRDLSEEMRAAWRDTLPKVRAELRDGFTRGGRRVNGWGYPAPGLAAFGTDDRFRSVVALGGLAALPDQEAMYLNTTRDGAEQPLDGRRRYRLRIPAGVPVDAFWSLTMYEPDDAGRYFFFANPLDRYAIGDRTPGLVRENDGTVVIALQNAKPAPEDRVNWLPAPAGPFRLSFRAYLPRAEFRDGRFVLPPVVEVK